MTHEDAAKIIDQLDSITTGLVIIVILLGAILGTRFGKK